MKEEEEAEEADRQEGSLQVCAVTECAQLRSALSFAPQSFAAMDRMLAMALLANDGQNPGSYYCLIRRRFKRRRKKRSERKGNPGRRRCRGRDGGCD